jgi:phosphoglycolate phosphatase-like HAD superfamily hydrolase
MQKIRAVIFDLDNTLIDFMGIKQESCRAAAHAMVLAGLPMTEVEAYDRMMQAYFAVGIESNEAFSEFLKSTGNFNHKVLAAAINAYLTAKSKRLKPYRNVKPTLKKLHSRGVFLAVVTDAPKTKAYQRLLSMKIEPYFRFVIGYEDTNTPKNTALPLKLALETLKKQIPNIENGEILMVGDSMERDVLPAENLGLQTALCMYGQTTVEAGEADFKFNDFKDLLRVV